MPGGAGGRGADRGALKQLGEGLAEVFAVRCDFQCPRPVLVHDEAAALHLYRIAQEATSNAVKHGQARQVTIRLGAATGGSCWRSTTTARGSTLPPQGGPAWGSP